MPIEPQYIEFLNLHDSLSGLLLLSGLLITLAYFRPFLAIAVMIIFPTVLRSASFRIVFNIYPLYPLAGFLLLKYRGQIRNAIIMHHYGAMLIISGVIVIWSVLSPLVYPARDSLPVDLTTSPSLFRGIQTLVLLLILPAVLINTSDVRTLIHSIGRVLIDVHVLLIFASVLFWATGYSLEQLHKMCILDTPPVYWESGLLLICLVYLLIYKEVGISVFALLSGLAVFGLIVGNSRTRFVACAVCLLYFIYPLVSIRSLLWIPMLLFLGVVLFISAPNNLCLYISDLVDQRIDQTFSDNVGEVWSGRNEVYAEAFDVWRENPITGVGACYILSPIIINERGLVRRYVHMYYLEVLAGQGLIGISLLMVILTMTAKRIPEIQRIESITGLDGRLVVALFLFGCINWCFKESWGVTYPTIAIIDAYARTKTQWSDT